MGRTMPVQKPGRSVQEVGTPLDFLDAVQNRFGEITTDLAANGTNAVATPWYGPDSDWAEDSLTQPWHNRPGLLWLNPPYADIGTWAEKCKYESRRGAVIALLIPAAVGTNYWRNHIHDEAQVHFLSPRLTFVGHTQSYPKDLALCMYGLIPGYECWRWKP